MKTLEIGLYSVFLNVPIKKKFDCKRKRTLFYLNFSSIATANSTATLKNKHNKAKEKNSFYPSDRVTKKSHLGGRKKKKIHIFFVTKLYYFTNFSIWNLRTMFIWNNLFLSKLVLDIFAVFFKTSDNFFQYILIRKFITMKDDWTKYRHC